jgi:hypothetical protein
MISTAPTEWIVTRPLAFGRQALAPADTTIGNSKTFECDAGCAAEFAGCATELKVVALKAIKTAAQDTGNVICIVISPLIWLAVFVKWRWTRCNATAVE